MSLLAPLRRAGRLGRSTSTTHSPWSTNKQVSPAPKLPVPSTAHTLGPGAWRWAKPSSCRCPALVVGTVAWTSIAPVGSQTAAVWVSRWVSTPMTNWIWPSSMPMRRPPWTGDRCAGAGLDGSHRGRTVTGHAHGRTGF
jgi:hypothetical protein